MPGSSATRPAPAPAAAPAPPFGLTAKIFLASALLVVAVLGITFGVTSVKAHRTADASIHRALLSTRRAQWPILRDLSRARRLPYSHV